MVHIDAATHDHILNTILSHSPPRTWLIFRATSTVWRDEVDRRLAQHIVITTEMSNYEQGNPCPDAVVSSPGFARLPSLLGAAQAWPPPQLCTALTHTRILEFRGFLPLGMVKCLTAHAGALRCVRISTAKDAWRERGNRVLAVPFPAAAEVVVQAFVLSPGYVPGPRSVWEWHRPMFQRGTTLNLPAREGARDQVGTKGIMTASLPSPEHKEEPSPRSLLDTTLPTATPHAAPQPSPNAPPRVVVTMPETLLSWQHVLLPRLTSVDKRYDEQSRPGALPPTPPPSPPSHRTRPRQQIIVVFPDKPLFQRGRRITAKLSLTISTLWAHLVTWSADVLASGCAVTFVNVGPPVWRDVLDPETGDVTNPCSAEEEAQSLFDRYWVDFELSQRCALDLKTRARLRFLSTEAYVLEVGQRRWKRETVFAPLLPLCDELSL